MLCNVQRINFDDCVNENKTELNEKWPYIPDHPYRILIIGGSVSGKTNALINLINEQNDIDKIYLYERDFSEPKYEYLTKTCEDAGIKHLNNLNVQMCWTMFMRILMITIQSGKEKN